MGERASVLSKDERLRATNPLTGERIGDVANCGVEEIRRLVGAARSSQLEWSRQPLKQRLAALETLRRFLAASADEIAGAIRAETGKVIGEALVEVAVSCEHLAYLSRHAESALSARHAASGWLSHRRARVAYEPYGVVAAITPWNYPFAVSMGVVASALSGGNAVVLKPSEYTPLVGLRVGELAGRATGLLELVGVATGDGETGAALVRADIDKVAFTGSTATGRKIMAAAAERLTPVVLELGGKDAMIVCEDADIERAARGAVWGAFFGCGQVCMSVERAYVVEAVYDDFVGAVVAEARRVRTSDEPEAMIGSLIAPFQLEKLERQLNDARERGARVLLGGRRVVGPGYFFEPTVLVDVTHDMQVMRDETFGPVLPIMRVTDEQEALRLAADTEYGLDASVWSRDKTKARRMAEKLDVGTALINDHLINYSMVDVPFGGVRLSGFGRVHGLEGMREFVRPKSWVEDRIALRREPHWFVEGQSGEATTRAMIQLRHGRGLWRRLAAAWELVRGLRR